MAKKFNKEKYWSKKNNKKSNISSDDINIFGVDVFNSSDEFKKDIMNQYVLHKVEQSIEEEIQSKNRKNFINRLEESDRNFTQEAINPLNEVKEKMRVDAIKSYEDWSNENSNVIEPYNMEDDLFESRFGYNKSDYAKNVEKNFVENDRIKQLNKRIDSEQSIYDQELYEAQTIVDERKKKNAIEAYEHWKSENTYTNNKNTMNENEIFKEKFGTSKEKYVDEISEVFDERNRIGKKHTDEISNLINDSKTEKIDKSILSAYANEYSYNNNNEDINYSMNIDNGKYNIDVTANEKYIDDMLDDTKNDIINSSSNNQNIDLIIDDVANEKNINNVVENTVDDLTNDFDEGNNGFSQDEGNNGFSQDEGNNGFSQDEGNNGFSQGEGNNGFSQDEGNNGFSQGEGNNGFSQDEGNNGFSQDEGNNGFSQDEGNNGFSQNEGNNGFSSSEYDISNITVETTIDENGKKIIKKTFNAKQKTPNNFDYGKAGKDTTTIGEIARNIYGEKYTPEQAKKIAESYAMTKSGSKYKDTMYEKGFDHSKIIVNKNSNDVGTAVGSVLADEYMEHPETLVDIIDSKGNVNTDKIIDAANHFKKYGGIDAISSSMERQAIRNNFEKEYSAKEADFLKKAKNVNKKGSEIKDVLAKIENNEKLEADEIKQFKEYQSAIQSTRDEMIDFAEDLGYSAESVFGEGFKLSKEEKKKRAKKNKGKKLKDINAETVGTRSRKFDTISFNNINSRLKWDDIEFDEDGNYYSKSQKEKENLSNVINDIKKDQDFAKGFADEELNKDNYLKYLEKNDKALDGDAKKLYNLKQQGIDIGENAEEVLRGYAVAHKQNIGKDNGAYVKLQGALETISSTEEYMNISDDNIERVGKDLTYEDGKYKLRKVDIKEPTEEINKIINSENIGTENIKKVLDQENLEKAIKDGNFEDTKSFNETIKNRFDTLEDSKYSTGFDMKKQLTKLQGVDEKIADEIVSAKANNSFDDLSVDAKVALSKMKDIDEDMLNYGNLDKENLTKMWNNNKAFFGGLTKEKIENMSKEELAKMFGETLEKNNVGVLASGYRFKIAGKDLNKEKDFAEFFDQIIDNEGKITFAKLADMMYIDEMGSFGTEETVKLLKEGKSWKEVQQAKLAKNAIGFLTESLSKGSANLDGAKKEAVDKAIKQLKTKKMEDVMKDSLDMDKMSKYAGKIEKIGENSNGIIDRIKGFKPSGKMLGTVAAVGAIAGIGMFASNAAEERERKRQEMQQLMMAQNQAIRGGY